MATEFDDWLDDEQQLAWRTYINATARLAEALEHDLKRGTGLSMDDYELLVCISESADGRARMSDLAEHLVASRSRLTYRVDRLEKLGLVVRKPCPDDGRSIHAEMTDEGWKRLRDAAPVHVASVRRHLVDKLAPADFLRLGALLDPVLAGLEDPDHG